MYNQGLGEVIQSLPDVLVSAYVDFNGDFRGDYDSGLSCFVADFVDRVSTR